MSKFKFSYDDQQLVIDVITNYVHNGLQQSQLFDRIEQIVSERDVPELEQQEFIELLYLAKRVQMLYLNGKYGLSDRELQKAKELLDDIQYLPSPPKQPK